MITRESIDEACEVFRKKCHEVNMIPICIITLDDDLHRGIFHNDKMTQRQVIDTLHIVSDYLEMREIINPRNGS